MRPDTSIRLDLRFSRLPMLLMAACLSACLDEGGDDNGADVRKSVLLTDTANVHLDPVLVALPDSTTFGFWRSLSKDMNLNSSLSGTRLSSAGEVLGQPFEPMARSVSAYQPVADVIPGGSGVTLAWYEIGPRMRDTRLKVRRLASVGRLEPIAFVPPKAANIGSIAVLSLPDTGFALACAYIDSNNAPSLWIARFDLLGEPIGSPFLRTLAADGQVSTLSRPALVARPGGGWLALWKEIERDDRAFIVTRRFDAAGASSVDGPRWEIGEQGYPAEAGNSLQALPFPGGRILLISEGDAPNVFLLDGEGSPLPGFEDESSRWSYPDWTYVAPVDSGKGLFLAASGYQISLVDSNLVVQARRILPYPNALVVAAAYTAAGHPAVIMHNAGSLEMVLVDRFWR